MSESIKTIAIEREITRLCHFTPSRNLSHIIAGKKGVLATVNLEEAERNLFNPTDLSRLDGHKTHICCTIEYPNPFYFAVARNNEILFKDWVVLIIEPYFLWTEGTRFCQNNASRKSGTTIGEGENQFRALYSNQVSASVGKLTRQISHLPACPTDLQAEVLVEDQIPESAIMGIMCVDAAQVRRQISRLKVASLPYQDLNFIICPDAFDRNELTNKLRNGVRPQETKWSK